MSQNKADKVLDPDINKRALLLDEADVAYFDVWNMKYNYSAFTPKSSIDLLPLYPLLMDFFAQEGSEEQYKGNKQRCTELLLAYIHNKNPSLDAYVKTLSISRLEKLQDAAYTARHLKYNEDYSIVTEAVTETPLGDKKVAAAMCRLGSRINKNARFSSQSYGSAILG